MKVEGIPEEGIVFGIQIPEEDVWVQLFLLLMKRLKPFFGLIRRIVNPCHENRKTRQANNGLGLPWIKTLRQFPFLPPW